MTGNPEHELVKQDLPQFISLAKRLAIHKLFQKCKAKGEKVIRKIEWRRKID
jgi:hypothetical protein